MVEVDDGDGLVVEVVPEGICRERVVDVHILYSKHSHWHSFHEQDLLLLRVRTVQRRVHPESVEAVEVVEADGEDDTLEGLGLGGERLDSCLCELECNSVARRSRCHAWQVDEVWLVGIPFFSDAPLECELRKDVGW